MKKPKTITIKGWSPADLNGRLLRTYDAFTVYPTKKDASNHSQVSRRLVRVEAKISV